MRADMNLAPAVPDDLNTLLVDSALAAIEKDAPLAQIEAALRSLSHLIMKTDPLRQAIIREAAIRLLRDAGVRSPAALVDVALGPKRDDLASDGPFRDTEPWPEPVGGRMLLDEIATTFRRFVVLSGAAADAQALWTLHTYNAEAHVSPNLCIRSPEKRCGKTRNLEILGCLVHRPIHTANISVAALYRTIDRYRPTLLIDEADRVFTRNDELRTVVNAGLYASTAFVLRCAGDRQQPKLFSVWCPKVMALIGGLPSTLEDRSIIVSMRRRLRAEPVETFRYDTISEELETLRRRAARWTADHMHTLARAEPAVPEQLHDRAQDLWRPLLAIAEAEGGRWPERACAAAVELSNREFEESSSAVQLLHHLRTIFQQHQVERLSSTTLVSELTEMEDRPWPECMNGKPLTKVQLARALSPFGIQPKVLRFVGNQVSRGYRLEDLTDAFRRYIL